jgi:endonuclease/exonuclease/phosphatase family metal-dependent hydrolase
MMRLKNFVYAIAFVASLGSCGADKTTNINWATFNIRYDNPEDSLNNWKYRRDSVANYIKAKDIDIVGMQEVLYSQLQDLAERLPEYAHVGVCRDDGDKKGEASPIFYKTSRFEALDKGNFWLSQYPDSAGFIGWDGACCRIASWAKLKDKKNGNVFMAVNTHFDHVGVLARRNAALLIIDRIKKIVGDKPAVLTGDFNVSDTSQAYKTITENEFVLKDSHKIAAKTSGPAYSWHDWGKEPKDMREKIDFIFVTEGIKVNSSEIYKEHDIDPNKPETQWGYFSDHNPVVINMEFK